ncbi:hypothetical protein [Aeromicrobium sp.]|uniref:hypothetical protein n=1 Tax=Aeromicrobium sp. TaxID=1871063 RepID=UPI002FC9C30B
MRNRGVTVLTVIGVLSAGTAAMAVNADTFGSPSSPNDGASSVLAPGADLTPTLPERASTPSDTATEDVTPETTDLPLTVVPRAAAPAPANPKPHTAPKPRTTEDDGHDEDDDEHEDEHEDEEDEEDGEDDD